MSGSTGGSKTVGGTARSLVQGNHLLQSIGRRSAQHVQHLRHRAGDIKKAYLALQERFNRNLIGRVEYRRSATSRKQCLTRKTK